MQQWHKSQVMGKGQQRDVSAIGELPASHGPPQLLSAFEKYVFFSSRT